MSHGSYGEKLFDPRWKSKRATILQRDNYQCVVCKSRENLHVHHRQYHFSQSRKAFNEPWEYPDHLLITLCELCNHTGHRLYKVPAKIVD